MPKFSMNYFPEYGLIETNTKLKRIRTWMVSMLKYLPSSQNRQIYKPSANNLSVDSLTFTPRHNLPNLLVRKC